MKKHDYVTHWYTSARVRICFTMLYQQILLTSDFGI